MGARRTEYQIVGRYMDGKEVTAYHLQSLENGKAGRYSREQVAYLVGRGQITNCTGQIFKDKLLLRGEGISLEDLPVQQENGELKKADSLGRIRRGTDAASALTQVMIVGVLSRGRNVVGYTVQNAGGGKTNIERAKLLELARDGKVGNARVQLYQGKPILKGVGVDLTTLPRQEV
jgi:hypothetical protein